MSYLPRGLRALACAFVLLLSVNAVAGQTPPPTSPAPRPGAAPGQTPPAPAAPPAAAPRPRPPAPRSTMVFVHVRNAEGRPLSGVHVVVSGAAARDVTTDFEGIVRLQTMADGAYHVRFDRDGFVSLEQDLALKAGQPEVVNVVLNTAPEPPPSPPPPPAAAPEPPPPAPPPVSAVPPPTEAEQRIMSIPDFLNKNFIGREDLKESTLGCTGTATTRLIQIKNVLDTHAHADVDEALYVVAGEGTLMLSERIAVKIGPGSLGIIPRGARHSIEKKGKNPLILLSTQSGAPCAPDASSK